MNIKDFYLRCQNYFGNDAQRFIELLNEKATHGFFLNTCKSNKEDILSLIDFNYHSSGLNSNSYYTDSENIGKTLAYNLGLIYPQDVESSYFCEFLKGRDFKLIVDLCAAPGGKSIDVLNTFNDCLLIANDVSCARASIISSNFERLGYTDTLITSTDISNLTSSLKGNADLVILDAPCSGEGMIRKYPEIIENLKEEEYRKLEDIQMSLLDEAYSLLKEDGILVYSTCTYNPGEDELQLLNFLERYKDMELIPEDFKASSSKLKGTVKLSPLNGTEGQFISILKKNSNTSSSKIKYLKTVKNSTVEKFIKDNLNIKDYYLYSKESNYYLSLKPMPEIKGTIRAGLHIGQLKKDRFEPSHMLYRSNELKDKFRYRYELNDSEYRNYIKGLELNLDLPDNYYLLTYKGHSFAYGRVKKGIMKNKYPKGLREMV